MACKYQIADCKCSNIVLEKTADNVDIFFVTEFPGNTETKEKKFLSGALNKHFRETLKVLKEKTGFTYAISGITRSTSKPGVLVHSSPVVKACINNLEAEIERCKPKVIILLGSMAYSCFSKHNLLPKHGDRVEDGRLVTMNIFGNKLPTMFCQHPTWYTHNEACAVGVLYKNIYKAIEYAQKKENPNIPNITTTETLRSLKSVKEVLEDMRQTGSFVSVDTEGIGLNRVYGNRLLSVQLCNDGKIGYLIPVLHKDSPFIEKVDQLRDILTHFFFLDKTKVLGYQFVNAKYDYHQFFKFMGHFNLNAPIIDISFAEYSLEENMVRIKSFPSQKGPFSLFTMSYKRGFKFYSDTDSKSKRTILDKIPLSEWEEYAGADVISPWHIFRKQMQEAQRYNYFQGFMFLNCIYANHLLRTLTYAEHCGLAVNKNKINTFLKSDSVIKKALSDIMDRFYALPTVQEANARLSKSKTGMATGLAGSIRTWTPTSPKHRELLYFDVMGLDPVNEEDDGDNSHTGKAFQKNYTGVLEVDLLAEFMSFDKMMSGFINPMSEYLDKNHPNGSEDMFTDNRARTHFYPLAVTGRTRCVTLDSIIPIQGTHLSMKKILDRYNPRRFPEISAYIPIRNSCILENRLGVTKSILYKGVMRITDVYLKNGIHIGTTKDTPILILNKNFRFEWKLAGKLKYGDLVCISSPLIETYDEPVLERPSKFFFKKEYRRNWTDIKKFLPSRMTPSLAKIIGYLLSDGRGTGFAVKDKEIFMDFIHTWKDAFGFSRTYHKEKRINAVGEPITLWCTDTPKISPVLIKKYFDLLGINPKERSHTYSIPWSIFSASTESKINFIVAYIEGDGWSYDNQSRVCICTTSEKMAYDLQQLLLTIGIISYVRDFPTKKVLSGHQLYVDISGIFCDRFMSLVGKYQVSNTKLQRIRKSSIKNGGPYNFIPMLRPYLTDKAMDLLPNKDCETINRRTITKKFLWHLQQNNNQDYKVLRYILENDIYFSKVKKIEKTRKEEVADFQVYNRIKNQTFSNEIYEPHFIANGLIIHNSSSPNLQQRPAGRSKAAKEILSMYEPRKGKVVIKLDYATFEVKGTGFLSFDKVMIKSFQDMHVLKEKFRENPTCFLEEGYQMQKDALLEVKATLKKRKQELEDMEGVVSKKEYEKAKEAYDKEYSEFKESVEKLKKQKVENPVELSKSYVTMLSDSHRKFASLFFKTPVTKVTKVQRQSAKSLVFGLIYGMSLPSIAKVLKITEDEAKALHDKYMKSFPHASKWLEQSKKFARKHFYVQSPLGRRRRLWGHLRIDKGVSGKMDRYAGNTVIQGVCSDNNLIAGSLVTYEFEAHNKLKYQCPDNESWELTNIIHDSCEFEIPLTDVYYFIKEFEKVYTDYLTHYLEEVFGFRIDIPLEVDFTFGTNYGNTRDWNGSEEDLIDAIKWLCEEVAKRDKTDVMDYRKIIKSPLYKKYPKGFSLEVIEDAIKRDLRTVKRLGLTVGQGGTK